MQLPGLQRKLAKLKEARETCYRPNMNRFKLEMSDFDLKRKSGNHFVDLDLKPKVY